MSVSIRTLVACVIVLQLLLLFSASFNSLWISDREAASSTAPSSTSSTSNNTVQDSNQPDQTDTDLDADYDILLNNAVKRCFDSQPRPCPFDYKWAPLPHSLFQTRKRNDSSGHWLPVPQTSSVNPPQKQSRKLNVLYYTTHSNLLTVMDRFFYDEIDAAITHPHLNVFLWGPHFPGWNDPDSVGEETGLSETVELKLKRVFPEVVFDIVYMMDWNYGSRLPREAVLVMTLGDCHNTTICVNQMDTYEDVIGLRYAGEIMDLFRPDQWVASNQRKIAEKKAKGNVTAYNYLKNREMPFFFHHTDCAPESVFYPTARKTPNETWADSRPYNAQLFGFVWDGLYPLRHTIREGIHHKKIGHGAKTYTHPGYDYTLPNTTALPPGHYDPFDPRTKPVRDQRSAYATALRQTKICMFDSSTLQKAIRKFHESFMSGCVVAANLPIEMEDIFRDVVIPLRLDMTAEE
ncbi:hypothetical protein HDU79_004946, partial [Rhizoclosmatium sp. JEL0117]